MNLTLLLIPVIAAFIGWFTIWMAIKLLFSPKQPISMMGFKLQGILPQNKSKIANTLAKTLSDELISFKEIKEKIVNQDNIDKLMPFVEENVDHFLRVKLAEKMPVISMFIGEKTIVDLKEVFIEELTILFPDLLRKYIGGLATQIDIESTIALRINALDTEKVEEAFYTSFGKQLNLLRTFGALFGFILGLIQLLIAV